MSEDYDDDWETEDVPDEPKKTPPPPSKKAVAASNFGRRPSETDRKKLKTRTNVRLIQAVELDRVATSDTVEPPVPSAEMAAKNLKRVNNSALMRLRSKTGVGLPKVTAPTVAEMSPEEIQSRAIVRMAAFIAAGYMKSACVQRIAKEFDLTRQRAEVFYAAALTELVPVDEEDRNRLRANLHGMSKKLFKIAVDKKDVKGGVLVLDRLAKLYNLDMTPAPTHVVNVETMQIADLRGDTRRDDFLQRAKAVGIDTQQAEKLLQPDTELSFDDPLYVNATEHGSYASDVMAGINITDGGPVQTVSAFDDDSDVQELQRYHQEKQGVKIVEQPDGNEKVLPLFPPKG